MPGKLAPRKADYRSTAAEGAWRVDEGRKGVLIAIVMVRIALALMPAQIRLDVPDYECRNGTGCLGASDPLVPLRSSVHVIIGLE